MAINSFSFLLFFIVVFIVYYLPVFKKTTLYQNGILLLSSYFFYAYADWRMVPLLFVATVVFYYLGLWIKKEIDEEKWNTVNLITTIGVILGIGILLYFKYFNFFADSIAQLLTLFGLNTSWTTLNIIIPIGVSFFTFKLISYVIEVSNEAIEPTRDFVSFAVYVSFFSTILSGPIDRPNNFIPQLRGKRRLNYPMAVDGCRQILWGMFIKMCIADNLAPITDSVWANYQSENGSTLLVVAILYFVQLYTDFDGYSHMAIGVGKLLNIRVARNFNHPLLSRNVADFWRRWHMSLTTWITDYVYTPLNYSFRGWGTKGVILAVFINLFVIGLWHGANWTYILFGVYHGILFIPLVFSGSFGKNTKLNPSKMGLPKLGDMMWMLLTGFIISIGLIIFRAPTVADAFGYINSMFSSSLFSLPSSRAVAYYIIVIIFLEWIMREKEHALQSSEGTVFTKYRCVRWFIYLSMVVLIFLFSGVGQRFIYAQF